MPYVPKNAAARTVWLPNRIPAVSPEPLGGNSDRKVITVLQKMPWVGAVNGAVLINIDQNQLFNDYFGNYHNKRGAMLVLDQNNRPLYAESGTVDAGNPDHLASLRLSSPSDSYIDEERNIVTYTTSKLTGWKYINITPKSLLMQKMNRIGYIVLGVSIFYISAAVLLSFWISRRMYRPLRTAIAYIGSRDERKPGSLDEAGFIRHIYDQMTTS